MPYYSSGHFKNDTKPQMAGGGAARNSFDEVKIVYVLLFGLVIMRQMAAPLSSFLSSSLIR